MDTAKLLHLLKRVIEELPMHDELNEALYADVSEAIRTIKLRGIVSYE